MDTTNENVVMNDQVQVMDIPEAQEVQPEVVTQYVEVPTTNKAKCVACGIGGFATGVLSTLGVIFLIKKIFKKEDPKPAEPEVEEE